MSYQTIQYDNDGQVAVLTFHRPEARNAINEVMIGELDDILKNIAADKELRVLILTGTGKSFVAGGDISMIDKGLDHPYDFFLLHDILCGIGGRLERLKIPVIAAINGAAFGGGLELALACDFRIMADTAQLGMPEAGLGIIPGAGGTARLARIIGREQAFLMEMTADPVGAEDAFRIGLVSEVAPQEEILEAAHHLARRICVRAPAAVSTIKRAIIMAENMPLEGAIDYCQQAAMLLGVTEDAREGMRAFLEKRSPIWKGK
ncbi:Enoyl-CoA hydratase [hydrothermal vent metagenome]|uniref:Enoyl-CoA hydratase n=1 Tax=hydrothermal vent metagenome TaxID=652676 RepID=A0A3B0RQC8_9ZZZZ